MNEQITVGSWVKWGGEMGQVTEIRPLVCVDGKTRNSIEVAQADGTLSTLFNVELTIIACPLPQITAAEAAVLQAVIEADRASRSAGRYVAKLTYAAIAARNALANSVIIAEAVAA